MVSQSKIKAFKKGAFHLIERVVMHVETIIKLNRFQYRDYQLPMVTAIENYGFKRVMAIMHRRAGKDIAAFNFVVRQASKRVGVYYYIFPTYAQAKKAVFDSITNDGVTFLSYIPKELVASINSQEMKIRMKNNSIIQFVGSDNYDALMGTNPIGIVFSEFALQDPRAWDYIRPILVANDGWAIFISTPRGKNHLWELYNIALNSDKWFCYVKTVDDTGLMTFEQIEQERAQGMSEELIQQEFYCSFLRGVEGSIYQKYIDKMRVNGQIGVVPWEPSFKVNTAWDIGVRDNTSIIFFQVIGQTVRIIDCYEKNKEGLEHYIRVLESKPYSYNKHFAPHDIAVREWGSGLTRLEKAKHLGITFTVAPDIALEDGIEHVRATFSKIWIDDRNAQPLIKALENYRRLYDAKKNVYSTQPLHDQWSHYADSMRYLCLSLNKLRDGLTPEELDRRYKEARYGVQATLPSFFQNDI